MGAKQEATPNLEPVQITDGQVLDVIGAVLLYQALLRAPHIPSWSVDYTDAFDNIRWHLSQIAGGR